MTNAVNIAQSGTNNVTFRNKIINGGMVIDQRNSGASVTPTADNTYVTDRWAGMCSVASKYSLQQNAGSVTPPAGFTNYLGATSLAATSVGSSDYYFVNQVIEGYNMADLAWGTASAKSVTLSFWVYSSLTGTFGGALGNGSWSYPFTYTISSANTWTQASVTVTGATSGTWATNNLLGMRVQFGLGVGSTYSGTAGAWANANYVSATGATQVVATNGATWYITGVQFEKGTAASPFENRLYGTELALCQRYYQVYQNSGAAPVFAIAQATSSSTVAGGAFQFLQMRASPTGAITGSWYVRNSTGNSDVLISGAVYTGTNYGSVSASRTNNGLTSGDAAMVWTDGGYVTLSAEL